MDLNLDELLKNVDVRQLQKALTPRLTKYIPIKPTAKQAACLLMNGTREVLYGGAAGGGKSVYQLAAALQYVDIPGYSAILFRKTFSDLNLPGALLSMSKEWLMPFVQTGEVHWSEKKTTYTFPSGATLSFGYLESDNDCFRYQGAEFQYIGIDECTHISPTNYRYLFSRLRKTKDLDVPLRFRATANPGGQYGEYYYQRFFIEGKEKGRVFLGAGLNDNPHLDTEEYVQALDELDPVTREQLLNGNWEIKEAGDMFSRTWFTLVDSTDVPDAAIRVRFWDMASTDPKKRKSKDKRDPDYTVGTKLAFHNGFYWIEDIVRVQKSPAEVEKIIQDTAELDGYSCAIRMEEEPGSSGAITIDNYARKVLVGYDFQGVRSTGSKVERARPASAAAQQGRVFITKRCRNMVAFYDELDVFPYGSKDDTIDGFSGSFNHFRKNTIMSAPTSMSKSKGSYWKRTR
jgi:predicted phage terminase large subunit-like protein